MGEDIAGGGLDRVFVKFGEGRWKTWSEGTACGKGEVPACVALNNWVKDIIGPVASAFPFPKKAAVNPVPGVAVRIAELTSCP
jgi:hypothetical protein